LIDFTVKSIDVEFTNQQEKGGNEWKSHQGFYGRREREDEKRA